MGDLGGDGDDLTLPSTSIAEAAADVDEEGEDRVVSLLLLLFLLLFFFVVGVL